MSPLRPLSNFFRRQVLGRRSVAFVVLGLSFVGFAICTLSLGTLVKANLELIALYGWQALMDGAARQLLELVVSAYGGMAFYVVFKACEYRLVHRLSEDE